MNIFGIDIATNIAKDITFTLVILAIALFARIVAGLSIKTVVKKLEDDNPKEDSALEQRTLTLASIFRNAINLTIVLISILMIMSQWGIDIAPVLAGAGILGLAVGFGAQTLVKDVVNGFFVLLENTYNVGDEIKIGGHTGKVIRMNLRTTVLIDNDGNFYTIPNSTIGSIQKFPKNDNDRVDD